MKEQIFYAGAITFLGSLLSRECQGFLGIPVRTPSATSSALWARYRPNSNQPGGGKNQEKNDKDRQRDRNWIEKSSPTGIPGVGEEDVEEYTLKLHGPTFQIGPLSKRFYDALMSNAERRFEGKRNIPSELVPIYKTYSMDMAAKEATKAAMQENGLELVENPTAVEAGAWGVLENIQILENDNPQQDDIVVGTAETIDYAVQEKLWEPGQAFSFIARNVRGRLKELSLKDMLKAWNMEDMAGEMGVDMDDDTDPKVPLDSIKDYITVDSDEDQEDSDDDTEDSDDSEDEKPISKSTPLMEVNSLKDLGKDCESRSNSVPTRAVAVGFAGGYGIGYDVVQSSDLVVDSEKIQTVMEALEQHGCLVVEIGEEDATSLEHMWKATESFFQAINKGEATAPAIKISPDAGSRHAAVGYASYDNGAMQFLETRISRSNGDPKLLPFEVASILEPSGVKSLLHANRVLTRVGKNLAKVAIAQSFASKSTVKSDAELTKSGLDLQQDKTLSLKEAETKADLIVNELMDDGTRVLDPNLETPISMSPHRMCRYSDNGKEKSASAREVFGAHTDTSFVTVIPCAAVSGLEIYDSAAETWFRPELMARRHWEDKQLSKGLKLSQQEGSQPWHCRYVICVPGELLQLTTNNRIRAAVHRVVAATGGKSRLSAPVLLRARPKVVMDIEKYFGSLDRVGPLLSSCQGCTMEGIHDSLQPSGVLDET